MGKIIIKKNKKGHVKFEVLPEEALIGEYETDQEAARALRALLDENPDSDVSSKTISWMTVKDPYNPTDWKNVPMWICEHCGQLQNQYIQPDPYKVILKNDSKRLKKWICVACHKKLTREKQIEMEYK